MFKFLTTGGLKRPLKAVVLCLVVLSMTSSVLAAGLSGLSNPSKFCKTSLNTMGFEGLFVESFHELAQLLLELRSLPAEDASIVLIEEQYRHKIQEFETLLGRMSLSEEVRNKLVRILESEISFLEGENKESQQLSSAAEVFHRLTEIEVLADAELEILKKNMEIVAAKISVIRSDIQNTFYVDSKSIELERQLEIRDREHLVAEVKFQKENARINKLKCENRRQIIPVKFAEIKRRSPPSHELEEFQDLIKDLETADLASLDKLLIRLDAYHENMLTRREAVK